MKITFDSPISVLRLPRSDIRTIEQAFSLPGFAECRLTTLISIYSLNVSAQPLKSPRKGRYFGKWQVGALMSLGKIKETLYRKIDSQLQAVGMPALDQAARIMNVSDRKDPHVK